MRAIRYLGAGCVELVELSNPAQPDGGLIVRTEACGLCSGELMGWYMERKAFHVLGHEVAGIVEASADLRFPVGERVSPHHHAPCMECELCLAGRHVHCAQWRRTRLDPGGMSERFGVAAENLTDCLLASDLRPIDAALIEPLACVLKSVGMIPREARGKVAVVGLGSLGVTHLIVLGDGAVGYDVNPRRLEWARRLGLQARTPDEIEPADAVVVCVGSGPAIELGASIVPPGGTIVLFAPLAPGNHPGEAFNAIYFKDIVLRTTYSCGPDDTSRAAELLRHQRLRAEQVVSHFVEIEDLPMAYEAMKAGEILKAMVVFP